MGKRRFQSMFKIVKGYDSVTKTVRLPIPLVRKLEELAGQNGVSLNCLVVQCLTYALENLSEEEQNQ